MRMTALVIAVLFAVPALLIVLRPGSTTPADPAESAGHRRLEAFWSFVPVVMLIALIAYSAAA